MTSLELARGIAAIVRDAPADVDAGPRVLAFLDRNGMWLARVFENTEGISVDAALPKARRRRTVLIQVSLPFDDV